jgi:hypothetical protein
MLDRAAGYAVRREAYPLKDSAFSLQVADRGEPRILECFPRADTLIRYHLGSQRVRIVVGGAHVNAKKETVRRRAGVALAPRAASGAKRCRYWRSCTPPAS